MSDDGGGHPLGNQHLGGHGHSREPVDEMNRSESSVFQLFVKTSQRKIIVVLLSALVVCGIGLSSLVLQLSKTQQSSTSSSS